MADGALIERVSFAGGEIGRALRARTDLARYQISVEAMENYVVMVEGGATRRPGSIFVNTVWSEPSPSLLIPFRFTATDSYMIVLSGSIMQFIRNGAYVINPGTGLPFQLGTAFLDVDIPNIRTVARGNVIFLASGRLTIQVLIRVGLTSWTQRVFLAKGGPFQLPNLDQAQTIIVTQNDAPIYAVGAFVTLTANVSIFDPGHVNSVIRLDESNLSFIPEWAADEPLAVGEFRRYNGNVYEAVGGLRTGINPPTHTFGIVRSDSTDGGIWAYRHGDHGVVRISQFLSAAQVLGFVEEPLPLSTQQQATYRWWLGAWSDKSGQPTNIAWAAQRLWVFRGDQFWASSVNDPENFEESGEDDAAFSGKLLSPEAHGSLVEIQWASSVGPLIIGTTDVEWRVSGGSQGGPITAKTVTPTPDSKEGSAKQIVSVVDDNIMFVGRSGKRLNRCKIDIADSGSLKLGSDEPSVGVRDLFAAGPHIMAWQRDPHRVLWMAMNNGTLLGLTWMEKQKVLAVHHHPMVNAFVEDVACIPGAGKDDVYMIVRRTINGQQRRYIELLNTFFEPADANNPTASGAWYVDCGLGAVFPNPVTIVGGLSHLELQQVALFVDGAMQDRKTVSAGSVVLDRPGRQVLVGLPLRSYLLDLPRNVTTQTGPSTGLEKGVHEVNLFVNFTGGGEIGTKPKEGELPTEPIVQTGAKSYHTPIKLISGLLRMEVECEIGDEVQLFILNDDAMPCSILGLSPRLQLEET